MVVSTIGLESVHKERNDNGQRIISYATSIRLVIAQPFLTRTSTDIPESLQMDGL
jgi:hypothetical protein